MRILFKYAYKYAARAHVALKETRCYVFIYIYIWEKVSDLSKRFVKTHARDDCFLQTVTGMQITEIVARNDPGVQIHKHMSRHELESRYQTRDETSRVM